MRVADGCVAASCPAAGGYGGTGAAGPRGGIFNDRAYLRIFHQARAAAFGSAEAASLLARRPYDLRHAAVSTVLHQRTT
jgi:hypothetical protein